MYIENCVLFVNQCIIVDCSHDIVFVCIASVNLLNVQLYMCIKVSMTADEKFIHGV